MTMAEIKDVKLEDLDKNLKLETKIQKDDIVFYDVRHAPMRLYGLDTPKDGEMFKRMPDEAAMATSEGVNHLNTMTAGARVRFSTDSKYIALKVRMPAIHKMYHMPTTAVGLFGMNIGKHRRDMIVRAGVSEVIIGIDRDYKEKEDDDWVTYVNTVKKLSELFKGYCKVSVLYDIQDMLGYKDAPTDKGKEILLKHKLKLLNINR
jgi:hypothetical protein